MTGLARVVVGISGASGAAVGLRIVELLAESSACETHLVVTSAAERTLAHEIGPQGRQRLEALASVVHPAEDVGASIASGSFRTAGMIVAPCSIRTLTAIAGSHVDNLLVRAADVHLKERRRLVLLLREAPLHLGHLRAMAQASETGAIIAPLVPAFYLKPASIAEMVDQMARRAIGLLDLDIAVAAAREWVGEAGAA